jgi:hypothetical protein
LRRVPNWEEYPHTPVFLRKSAQAIERKRVDFLGSAEKRKRVRKWMKRKKMRDGKGNWDGQRKREGADKDIGAPGIGLYGQIHIISILQKLRIVKSNLTRRKQKT